MTWYGLVARPVSTLGPGVTDPVWLPAGLGGRPVLGLEAAWAGGRMPGVEAPAPLVRRVCGYQPGTPA